MTKQELTYWVTWSLMPNITTNRKNEIYSQYFLKGGQTIIGLFDDTICWNAIGLSEEEKKHICDAHTQLANNAFLVENMLAQGYEIIPIHSPLYSKTLKKNLGTKSPIVLFAKGNTNLLQDTAIAIVGSRNAEQVSLQFTDNISRRVATEGGRKVVVSGFAKGIDRRALDSTLEAGGNSIIVLPQGILTCTYPLKPYYKYIVQGHLLIISFFAPNAPWSTGFAMARNPIIYGMASEIYVAQSSEKGGTWSGVIDGLKKNRIIKVRKPEIEERNANSLLIQKGCKPVDMYGNEIISEKTETVTTTKTKTEIVTTTKTEIATTTKTEIITTQSKEIVKHIQARLSDMDSMTRTDMKDYIKRILNIELNDKELAKIADNIPDIEKVKNGNRYHYRLKTKKTNDLFSAD